MVEIPLANGAEVVSELLSMHSSGMIELEETILSSVHPPLQLKKSITLIVVAVILEGDKILMVHEANPYCYEKWHLPAGKVEPGETLADCFRRELVEETLLDGIPGHIISVNFGTDSDEKMWLRFAFIGHRTGGSLKTLAQADRHSLEAKWLPIQDIIARRYDLRQPDILVPIHLAIEHQHSSMMRQMILCNPIELSQSHLRVRIFLVAQNVSDSSWMVLVRSQIKSFPQDILRNACLEDYLSMLLSKSGYSGSFSVLGVLSVEHGPKENQLSDGLRINIVCEALLCSSVPKNADWVALDGRLCNAFERMKRTNSLGKIPSLCDKIFICA